MVAAYKAARTLTPDRQVEHESSNVLPQTQHQSSLRVHPCLKKLKVEKHSVRQKSITNMGFSVINTGELLDLEEY